MNQSNHQKLARVSRLFRRQCSTSCAIHISLTGCPEMHPIILVIYVYNTDDNDRDDIQSIIKSDISSCILNPKCIRIRGSGWPDGIPNRPGHRGKHSRVCPSTNSPDEPSSVPEQNFCLAVIVLSCSSCSLRNESFFFFFI